jgi:hypothetical protein
VQCTADFCEDAKEDSSTGTILVVLGVIVLGGGIAVLVLFVTKQGPFKP